ncbi:MAG: ribonuclease HI [Helicobacteraceae bacterium]|jgi:ribonuclease HI|nr:ribonuclease HI [Helicobacteraceae bacterium]
MKKVKIFTDGSSLGNPGFGGWCAILSYGDRRKVLKGGEDLTTNNRMELTAPIEALKALKEPCEAEIVTDSSYVAKGINEWLEGWQKKNFAKVKNPDLWKAYIEASKKHKICAVWVRGHNGHKENEECDQIAKSEAEARRRRL